MARFEVIFKRSVTKDFRPIPNKDVQRILARITPLAEQPRPLGAEKLSALERYRTRQGAYRILDAIHDAQIMIIVVKEGHRRDVYQRK